MGCKCSKHAVLDDESANLLGALSEHDPKTGFSTPHTPEQPPIEPTPLQSPLSDASTIPRIESTSALDASDFFATFDEHFPASPLGGSKQRPEDFSGPPLLPEVSGHNVLLEQRPLEKVNDKSAALIPNRGLVTQLSGCNLVEDKKSASPPPKSKKSLPRLEEDFGFVKSNVFVLENSSDHQPQQQNPTAEIISHADTERNNDTDQHSLGPTTDHDEYLQIAKTNDGTEYLELSMEFLEVNLPEEPQGKLSRQSSSCSGFSSSTGETTKKEKRRGRRRERNKHLPTTIKTSNTTRSTDGTPETLVQPKDKKKTSKKGKRKKKDKRRSKQGPATSAEVTIASNPAVANASIAVHACLDSATNNAIQPLIAQQAVNSVQKAKLTSAQESDIEAEKVRDPESHASASESGAMSSPRLSPTEPQKATRANTIPETTNQHLPCQDLATELPFDDLEAILTGPTVDADLAVVDDMWMRNPISSPKHSELLGKKNVRTIKIASSLPGDDPEPGHFVNEDKIEQERTLYDILNIDPWDREGSEYSDRAAQASIRRDPSPCRQKFSFDAFGHDLYPLYMICALGASVETVKACYESYPAAMDEEVSPSGSPLHMACAYAGGPRLLEWLIETEPAQLTKTDILQRSPFHVACLYSARVETVQVLVSKSPIGLEARDYESNTTLHVAAEQDAPIQVLQLLLHSHPAAARATRNDGSTPLHLATLGGADPAKIKALLDASSEAVSIADSKGRLPLHTALEADEGLKARNLKLLIQAHPEGLNAVNSTGETPFVTAKRLGLDTHILSVLVSSS